MRLTIRIREEDPTAAILATLHEGGHGLLDQGLSSADRDWLLGEAASMGLHESQARLWENHIGRSLAFWERALPELRRLFPDPSPGSTPDHSIARSTACARESTGSAPIRSPIICISCCATSWSRR